MRNLVVNILLLGAITSFIFLVGCPTTTTYTLTYSAGANGSISGTSPQTVDAGTNGTAVTAVPNTGYHFVQWSDVSTQNPRTDTNVQGNISVTASFAISNVSVPNVVDMAQAAAQSAITGVGLTVGMVTQQSSATVPAGEVISESPAAGTSVVYGSAVNLVVSQGNIPVGVPNVVGMTQGAAQTAITTVGLAVGTVTPQYNSTVPAGRVISQSPLAGASANPGSAVNFTVSQGPQLVTVPNVLGMTQIPAQTAILGASLTVGAVTQQPSDTVPAGQVSSQTPIAGNQAALGSAVNLVVSTGLSLPTGFIAVPETTPYFVMGGTAAETPQPEELPRHNVHLTAYQIKKFDVTNDEYVAMLNWALAQGILKTSGGQPYDGGDVYSANVIVLYIDTTFNQIDYDDTTTLFFTIPPRDGFSMVSHPVVYVSWYGAALYCNWLSESNGLTPCYNTLTWSCDFTANGFHLPSEAQWERAAAWDAQSSRHWIYGFISDTVQPTRANYEEELGDIYLNPLGLSDYPYTSPVGWFNGVNISPNGSIQTINSLSPVGCYDMTGNVWQWCNDWYKDDYYTDCLSLGTVTNPAGPAAPPIATDLYKVVRGGSWYMFETDIRTARRSYGTVDSGAGWDYGFRVARH